MKELIKQIKSCTICEMGLPHKPNPVLNASTKCRILIIGQAPGKKVHESGIPWDDQSGKTLRNWLNVSESTFYDSSKFAIIPMGFCFPGSSKSGDLPPRKECAPAWHEHLLSSMPHISLTLLIGMYAQKYYLKDRAKNNLTQTVQAFNEYTPNYIPLPHPSPRNRIWLKRNDWFEVEVLPELRRLVTQTLSSTQ